MSAPHNSIQHVRVIVFLKKGTTSSISSKWLTKQCFFFLVCPEWDTISPQLSPLVTLPGKLLPGRDLEAGAAGLAGGMQYTRASPSSWLRIWKCSQPVSSFFGCASQMPEDPAMLDQESASLALGISGMDKWLKKAVCASSG